MSDKFSPVENQIVPHLQQEPRKTTRDPGTSIHWYVRLATVFVLVLVVGISAGILVERNIIAQPQVDPPQFQSLEAVTDIVEGNYYYRPIDPTEEATWTAGLEQQAISGMLGSLDDDYTRYLQPPDARDASNQLAGKYEGIGVTVGIKDDRIVILDLVENGPAAKTGLMVGDAISAVDGRAVYAGDDISGLIQGPAGTTVTLDIIPGANESPISVVVTRAEIVTPQVHYTLLADSRIAVIKIDVFGDQTTPLVTEFLQRAVTDGAVGVVLDLRQNGGGWVTAAQDVIGRFVPASAGPSLYEDTSAAPGGEVPMEIRNGDQPLYSGPLVVLVDENTASASEIVAGALKDYDRALVVGRKTFGKGSVQRIYEFTDGASMRVTVAEWLTPSKSRIQDIGIEPSVDVAIDQHASTGQDADLAQAVALIEAGQSKPSDLAGRPVATPAATPVATPVATDGFEAA